MPLEVGVGAGDESRQYGRASARTRDALLGKQILYLTEMTPCGDSVLL